MSPTFLIALAGAGLFIWTVGAYSFWRISLSQKTRSPRREVQPVLRLAEQWMAESQKKIEQFAETLEQPLGTAQNELLELRLEAGRLPQGIKSLRLVRESLETSMKPSDEAKGILDLARLYLEKEDFREAEPSLAFWKTPLGDMPCLEVRGMGELSDSVMKSALARLNQALNQNPSTGGFLYFPDATHYRACLQNPEWAQGLKSLRVMVVDFEGLTALLVSLRLVRDTDNVIQVFREGVESTQPLTGQSDKMNEALSRLSGHSLKARAMMEGGIPTVLMENKEKA